MAQQRAFSSPATLRSSPRAPVDDEVTATAAPSAAAAAKFIEPVEGASFEPTTEEIREYAEYLGMDLECDADLLWIAERGLSEPLRPPWRACQALDLEVFYFNTETGESTWRHPCDDTYEELYVKEKAKRAPVKVLNVACSATGDGTTSVACTAMSGELVATVACEAGQDFAGLRTALAQQFEMESRLVRIVLPNAVMPGDKELIATWC